MRTISAINVHSRPSSSDASGWLELLLEARSTLRSLVSGVVSCIDVGNFFEFRNSLSSRRGHKLRVFARRQDIYAVMHTAGTAGGGAAGGGPRRRTARNSRTTREKRSHIPWTMHGTTV